MAFFPIHNTSICWKARVTFHVMKLGCCVIVDDGGMSVHVSQADLWHKKKKKTPHLELEPPVFQCDRFIQICLLLLPPSSEVVMTTSFQNPENAFNCVKPATPHEQTCWLARDSKLQPIKITQFFWDGFAYFICSSISGAKALKKRVCDLPYSISGWSYRPFLK